MRKSKLFAVGALVLTLALGLVLAGCDTDDGGGDNNSGITGGNTAVTFSGVTADGSSSQTTTHLTLTFNQAISGLSAGDISLSGVTGVTKGTLSGSGPTYILPISGFTSGGTLSVVVAKSGYNISGSPQTVIIYCSGGNNNVVIILESNAPDGWQKTYEPASLLNGAKITQGDAFTFTYSFTSDTAIDQLQVLLVDNYGAVWNVISDSAVVKQNIAANTVVSGSVTLTATRTATNATPEANRLVFKAGKETTNQPTLTFTTLKLETGGGGGTTTGLYLGIIGFNEDVTRRQIGLLNTVNKTQFQSFIDNLTMLPATGLYYAVDQAVIMLQAATLPYDLVNVSVVTFTDGLDNASIAINPNYNSRDEYRDAVSASLASTKIKNLNIAAYSIGIRGGDVIDVTAYLADLKAIASHLDNVTEVTNMDQVKKTFEKIAEDLNKDRQVHSIRLRLSGGYDDGDKIRFTFDDTDAASSNLYIEGTFSRNGTARRLEDVVYQGLTSSSGTTVSGDVSGVYVYFTFENTSTTSGGVNMDNVQQWQYIDSQTRWQRNSEFGGAGDTETIVNRKSAVIMLVLDCTTSLNADGATGFSEMKSAANSFIDVLVSGNGG